MGEEARVFARRSEGQRLRFGERVGLVVVMCSAAALALLSLIGMAGEALGAVNGTATLYLTLDDAPREGLVARGPGQVVEGRFDGVFALSVEDVRSGGLVLHAVTMAAGFALVATILAFVFYLCLRLYRGQPFGRLVTRGFATLAALTIAVTVLSPAALSAADSRILSSMGLDLDQAPFTTGYVFTTVDMLTLACGVFMALMAGAFHIGSRLAQDTDGLV
ncbi:hypothetical protein IU436_29430 [Nocardia farcinica]|uniref:hypothetical protein n=1 Tax=Nocardia TaxID=1817 RepID=UPI001893BC13|nr:MULTISPECIES: hypothetical protein [Nocardia]MBF6216371.1 hypothetical protein [Nocardia puris]MBF6422809.1 hypothetical protein [Nocardia farcinica]MBF6434446.1 hypothetical protein [Nocardia farcinica]MBF6505531.1 hypothetical protein [Nocardia farcinica]